MRLIGIGLVIAAALVMGNWLTNGSLVSNIASSTPAAVENKDAETAPTKPTETKTTTPKPATAPAPAPATSSTQFCPKFTSGVEPGADDTTGALSGTRGNVANLQIFLAKLYGLKESGFVDGKFDADTEKYLKQYQREQKLTETGILDYATKDKMLAACVLGLMANGAEYSKENISYATGAITKVLHARKVLQELGATIENGAFRIEVISTAGGVAKLRVTGPVTGGIQTETFSLSMGQKKITETTPKKLSIQVDAVDASGATFTISKQ